jgi:hypothetical protein
MVSRRVRAHDQTRGRSPKPRPLALVGPLPSRAFLLAERDLQHERRQTNATP